jgi:TIR domain
MPQGFKYACFVSYCHGQHDLVKAFIEQLKAALKSELDALLDEELYIDEERLQPSFRYNEALAQAICQSVCMIVVYSPRYERHEYCMREYEAMVKLEEGRRKLLGPAGRGRGFIIPVILRGGDDVPPRIREHLHYADFSRFTLATPRIASNPEYAEEIRKIAQVIYTNYRAFRDVGASPCDDCANFSLPSAPDVAAWRPSFVNR